MIQMLIWILTIPLVSLDLKHLLMETVTSVPRIQEEYNKETNNWTCKDILHMQHILVENVTSVPRTQEEYNEETKDLKCNHPMLKITYVLNPGSIKSPGSNKTSIGCFCEKPVAVKKCLEYNKNNEGITIIQRKGDAPCHNLSITPCKVKYFSSESYKLFECFEKYGGIPSPKELTKENQELKKQIETLSKQKDETTKQSDDKIQNLQKEIDVYKPVAIAFIVLFVILLVLFIFFIIFHVRTRKSKNTLGMESHPSISNSGTKSSTDNGDQITASLMKSNDEQKKENYENTGVEIPYGVDDMQLHEFTVDLDVGKPNLPPMSKGRDKKYVEYPVNDTETD